MHDAVLLGVLLAAIAIGFGLGIRYAYRRQQHSPALAYSRLITGILRRAELSAERAARRSD
ncbi:hypothetical protein HAALTHF_45170n [Vreelandella aquamarina]|nr:hypothetical protein HAALTHF_45170n [Halomonas axialensis]